MSNRAIDHKTNSIIFTIVWWVALITLPILLSSCCYQNIRYQLDKRPQLQRLLLEMPRNLVVFEELSGALYEELWYYLDAVGYRLITSASGSEAFVRLRVNIRSLEHVDTIISPDVQPYGHKVALAVFWSLLDHNNDVIGEMPLTVYGWVYKPCDPIFNRDYLAFQYRELLKQIPPCIDHQLRLFLSGVKP